MLQNKLILKTIENTRRIILRNLSHNKCEHSDQPTVQPFYPKKKNQEISTHWIKYLIHKSKKSSFPLAI